MSWIFLVGISVVSLSLASVLARGLLKDESSNAIGYAIVFQIMLGLISLGFALLFSKFAWPNFETTWPRFLISAGLWAITTVLSFKALKTITAAEETILTTFSTIVSVVLSVLLLGDTLTLKTLMGSSLILTSVWIVSNDRLSFKSKQGVLYALGAALFAGIAVINDAIILRQYEAFSYTAIMSLLPGLIIVLIYPKELFKSKILTNFKLMRSMFILCFFYSIQAITYYLAYTNGAPISQLSPLTKSSIVLTAILGAIFLKETEGINKKLFAAALVTFGAVLLG